MLKNYPRVLIRIFSILLCLCTCAISRTDGFEGESSDLCARNPDIESRIIKSFEHSLAQDLSKCNVEIEVYDPKDEYLGLGFVASLQKELLENPKADGFSDNIIDGIKRVRGYVYGKGFEALKYNEILNPEIAAGMTIINTIFPAYDDQTDLESEQFSQMIIRCLWRAYVMFSLENKGLDPTSQDDYNYLRALWFVHSARALQCFEGVMLDECNKIKEFVASLARSSSRKNEYFDSMYYKAARKSCIEATSASGIAADVIERISDIDECALAFGVVGGVGKCAFINEGDAKIKVISCLGMFEFTCTNSTLEQNIKNIMNLNIKGSKHRNIVNIAYGYLHCACSHIVSLLQSKINPTQLK